jgi:hypothetical protein
MDAVNKFLGIAAVAIVIYLIVSNGPSASQVIGSLASGTSGVFGTLQARQVTFGSGTAAVAIGGPYTAASY